MQHMVAVDYSKFPEGIFKGQPLVGPPTLSGIESCKIICSRVPPGCAGPQLHVHPVDQFYYVVSGTMNVQLGTDKFVAGPNTVVSIPAGTPHCNWNDGKEDEVHLEMFVPPPPPGSLVKLDKAHKVENANSLVRAVDPEKWEVKPNWKTQQLVRRNLGDNGVARIYIADTVAGQGGPSLHFHAFDQFYYVLEGELTIQIGLKRMKAGANTLVVLPAGTLHTNLNEGPGPERHIAILIPEPKEGVTADTKVEIIKSH
jgi:mannose-6-phosphate isomerase-like protein (cupin superfamily)